MSKKKKKNSNYVKSELDRSYIKLPTSNNENPDFSMKYFLTSPDVVGVLLLWGLSFVILYVAFKWVTNTTAQVIMSFLAISMTCTVTDRLVELYNEKKFGIKPKKKNMFGGLNIEDFIDDSENSK